MDVSELRARLPRATAAELELIARYAMLPGDPRRERSFSAFLETGLPHRRNEAWKWTDVKAALPSLAASEVAAKDGPLAGTQAVDIRVAGGAFELPAAWPRGIKVFEKSDAQAFGAAEAMPLGALTAALAGQKGGMDTLMIEVKKPVSKPLHFIFASDRAEASFARATLLVRPGASIHVIESHMGGAGLSSFLVDIGVQAGGSVTRTIFQRCGAGEVQAVTADVHLDEDANFNQTALAFGGKLTRIETHLVHQKPSAEATLNAAYLAGPGRHVDVTTHVRHGAPSCVTNQVTKGAVAEGGVGVFQGKFLVPRHVGQYTRADMQHHALLLEQGAEVNAKPELEIYADDVECAHGNTCGALDPDQLFYMRQRGIPESAARGLLTEAFVREALEDLDERLKERLLAEASAWLSGAIK